MTDTTSAAQQPGSGSAPRVSGAGLARLALQQARLAAKKNGDGEARAPRRRRATGRRDGREPSGFAAVLQGLMADRGWELPAAGGSVLDRWPDIAASVAPQLPAHVVAVAYHPDSRQLDLRPDSPAYATQLRLICARIIAAANSQAGTDAVLTVRVLAPGAAPTPRETMPAPKPAEVSPHEQLLREPASEGYRQALAAHQAAAPPRPPADPAIARAAERQAAAMRALGRAAFPEEDTAPEPPPPLAAARHEHQRQADTTHEAALRRAIAERAAIARRRAAVLSQTVPIRESA